jgi:ubiquinone/menaquinone biosynthesis C-methylase UbiE
MLTRERIRAFYDWFGAKQDWQRFYEDHALDDLIEHSALAEAKSVVEFGCGTGRLAERLLAQHLLPEAHYLGTDVSTTMVKLARNRLARFGSRAQVLLAPGESRLDVSPDSFDRFFSTYVLDLLPEDEIRSVVTEAHRVLVPGGLMGLVSLTHGFTSVSRFVETLWVAVHKVRPILVGGCRPLSLEPFASDGWNIRHVRLVVQWGVPSEVLVAEKPTPGHVAASSQTGGKDSP